MKTAISTLLFGSLHNIDHIVFKGIYSDIFAVIGLIRVPVYPLVLLEKFKWLDNFWE